MRSRQLFLTRLPEYLIALVLAVVPFYAFLTVWGGSVLGHYTLLRLWPEAILAPLAVWAIVVLVRDRAVRSAVLRTRLAWLVIAYLILQLLVGVIALWHHSVSLKALFYGLLVDTRPLIWFGIVWVFTARTSWLRVRWQQVILVPLSIVVVFAIMQFFVLPGNFLSHFGYKNGVTIAPIQTINQDTGTIRAQSFLRGANPLGAYLVVGVSFVLFAAMRLWRKGLLLAGTLLAILVTFSRSAWVGILGIGAAMFALLWRRKYLKKSIVIAVVLLIGGASALYSFRQSGGLQDALLHVNERHSTASITSNTGHLSGAKSAVHDMLLQPFGGGPGTAGPASIYNRAAPPRDSESYYLNIGQETGWLGIVLFVWILIELGGTVRRDTTPLGRGIFVSLIGLALVDVFSYAWTDPTLAYVWWGLAGLAVSSVTLESAQDRRGISLVSRIRLAYFRMRPSREGIIQFLYYNLGGIVFFVSGYGLFVLLYGGLHWYWLLAKGLADLVGWALNYFIQHYLVFPELAREHGHKKILKKYISFSLLNVLFDYAIVGGLRLVGITPFVGLLLASLFFTVWKWHWYKHWVFVRK